MRAFLTIILLVIANTFMTFAWYGHLKFQSLRVVSKSGFIMIVLASWFIALFEYFFQVPANRIGYDHYGGPFSLVELKVLQEIITLVVFSVFSYFVFKNEVKLNHIIGFGFLVVAVYFIFKK